MKKYFMQIDMIRKWELQYSDKIDFKTKVIKRDKEGHYIKDSIKRVNTRGFYTHQHICT